MRPAPEPALIIADGSLRGLVACWAEWLAGRRGGGDPRASGTVAWLPAGEGNGVQPPAYESRRRMLRMQAELCGLGEPIEQTPHATGTAGCCGASALLLAAAAAAIERGIGRVIWPACAGGEEADLGQVAEICDRAALVSHLASLDAGQAGPDGVRIETPYADFSDRQLMELAVDMDVPLWAGWWCEREGQIGCGTCGQCQRFIETLSAVAPGGGALAVRPAPSAGGVETVVRVGPAKPSGASAAARAGA